MILFDVETRPLPDRVKRFTKPFPQFDPSEVKMGNIKDPKLKEAKLAEKQAEHSANEEKYWHDAYDKAALNPVTASVICIGHCGAVEGLIEGDEQGVLELFWEIFRNNHGESFVFWSGSGFPGIGFDVEMLVKRSWMLGVKVPPQVFHGRYLSSQFVDLASRYLFGKKESFLSLSDAADQLGLFDRGLPITKKTDADLVTGKNFHEYWDGFAPVDLIPEEQRKLAIKYLRNDAMILQYIAGAVL